MPTNQTTKSNIDYLILGQGLAGSLLAVQLINQGYQVLVVDNQHKDSSSMVAAGLINPLAGLRFSHPPVLDNWVSSGQQLYQQLEKRLNLNIFHPMDMLRVFHNPIQQEYWQKRQHDKFLAQAIEPDIDNIASPLGGCYQHAGGYVDLPLLLGAINAWLKKQQALTSADIDYTDIRLTADKVHWQNHQATKLIFCEGYRAKYNPWFNWLPFTPAKGEILTLDKDPLLPDVIVNGKHWLVPQHNHQFRFGATYDRIIHNNQITAAARQQLVSAFKQLFPHSEMPGIITQLAGVRPATKDKMPFIGRHPKHGQLYIFNGFGGRGVLTMPYYSQVFFQHLVFDQQLPDDVNITRHSAPA